MRTKTLFTVLAVALLLIVFTAAGIGSDVVPSAYRRIQNTGSSLAMRPTLNFVNGGCADHAADDRTDCTVGGSGSGGYATIESAGTALTQRSTLNFVNGGCVDNAVDFRTDCTDCRNVGCCHVNNSSTRATLVRLYCRVRKMSRAEKLPF